MKLVILTLCIIVSLLATASLLITYPPFQQSSQIESKAIVLQFSQLEIANTPELRAKGLMGRASLCDTCGMLFIFDTEQIQSFWMKDTPTSLDMIFLDKKGKIVTIHQNTVPYQENPTYSSTSPAMYVLEVPADWVNKNNISEQQILNISALLNN